MLFFSQPESQGLLPLGRDKHFLCGRTLVFRITPKAWVRWASFCLGKVICRLQGKYWNINDLHPIWPLSPWLPFQQIGLLRSAYSSETNPLLVALILAGSLYMLVLCDKWEENVCFLWLPCTLLVPQCSFLEAVGSWSVQWRFLRTLPTPQPHLTQGASSGRVRSYAVFIEGS